MPADVSANKNKMMLQLLCIEKWLLSLLPGNWQLFIRLHHIVAADKMKTQEWVMLLSSCHGRTIHPYPPGRSLYKELTHSRQKAENSKTVDPYPSLQHQLKRTVMLPSQLTKYSIYYYFQQQSHFHLHVQCLFQLQLWMCPPLWMADLLLQSHSPL